MNQKEEPVTCGRRSWEQELDTTETKKQHLNKAAKEKQEAESKEIKQKGKPQPTQRC